VPPVLPSPTPPMIDRLQSIHHNCVVLLVVLGGGTNMTSRHSPDVVRGPDMVLH